MSEYLQHAICLKKAMNTRKSAKKRGECLLEELILLKAIHGGEIHQPLSAESSNVTPSTTKIADKINNFGNILPSRKRKADNKPENQNGKVLVKKTNKTFTFAKPLVVF